MKKMHFIFVRCLGFWMAFSLISTFCFFYALPSFAESAEVGWNIGLQEPASPSAQRIYDFHSFLLYIISGIVLFVLLLLIYVVLKFNARANPKPSNVTHNVLLEIIWTIVPVIILIVIVIPSFQVLYHNDKIEKPEMTLKITGYQWYWGYEYPDYEGLTFNAYMIPNAQIDKSKGQMKLLSTDNEVVLPVDTNIQILTTASDVIHSWAVPALGVKIDAVPGRTNETWFRINKVGTYYGQCSELCGKDHSFMPIQIKAVTKEEFAAWLVKAKTEFSSADDFVWKPKQYAQISEQ